MTQVPAHRGEADLLVDIHVALSMFVRVKLWVPGLTLLPQGTEEFFLQQQTTFNGLRR